MRKCLHKILSFLFLFLSFFFFFGWGRERSNILAAMEFSVRKRIKKKKK